MIEQMEAPVLAPVEEQASSAPFSALMIAVSAFLASAAVAWAAGGLFSGVLPRVAGIVAAAAGCAIVFVAYRSKRPAIAQWIGPAAVAGIAFLFSLTAGPTGGIASGIADAVRGGGPGGEPLPFDAGWRFLLVVLIASLGAGACSIAMLTARPRLAVVVPIPALIAASLVQPRGATLSSGLPAMMLLLAALAISFGVELASTGASNTRFEARRIARGAVAIVAVAGTLFGISHAGVLFPVPDEERVIPPRLPPDVPPTPDRVLFNVRTAHPGPWRLGVLDVYDDEAWLLPPYDPARLQGIGGGAIPGARARGRTIPVAFEIAFMQGPVLPSVASAQRITAVPDVSFDPRTDVLRVPAGRSQRGITYTLDAAPVASGRALAASGTPGPALAEFLAVPTAPAQVGVLLADAPRAPLWDRLQYVRTQFYRKVVAAGAGKPVAVPPGRAAAILGGEPASPFEITAAEALLARWAGIPSRIGYGFFRGDRRGESFEVHPRHGATWLEVYFEGNGWVPVVGVPPRARASLDRQDQQSNPEIRPTEQLALVLYVPVEQRSIRLFYVLARYWLAVTTPLILAIVAVIVFYPGALKTARRVRRARWADRRGARARVAVTYAGLRDTATDLGIADPLLTPMEFARAVVKDEELDELTWLVSRALWGDLTRDLRDEDAEVAERLARSIAGRLRAAQPAMTRILAVAARASLREPYTLEIPNVWPKRRRFRLRRLLPFGAALCAIAMLGSCGGQPAAPPVAGAALPTRIVPAGFDDVSFRREPAVESRLREAGPEALIDTARVYTFRAQGAVEGYLEVGSFRPDVSGTRQEVRRGVLSGIGAERFRLTRAGALRIYTATIGEQNFALWFAPEGRYFELLVQRRGSGNTVDLLARILEFQGRLTGVREGGGEILPPPDPRRGEASA